ncbi:hypothetical protein IGI49_004658 [Enterococcus sp. AZ071]
MNKYKLSFSLTGTLLFVCVMIPNIIWAYYPAQNDILRMTSVTPKLDTLTSVFQFVLIAIICTVKSTDNRVSHLKLILNAVMIFSITCYYGSWFAYYADSSHFIFVFLLSATPFLIFGCYIIKNRLYIALLPLILFSIGHILFAFSNFYALQ